MRNNVSVNYGCESLIRERNKIYKTGYKVKILSGDKYLRKPIYI